MNDGTVRSHTQGAGPERIFAAMGKNPDGWHAEFHAAGGQHLGHTAIAAWLVEHGVDGWWVQGVAIGYEQARGLRIPGQRSDGTFAVSASWQLPGERKGVLDRILPDVTAAVGFDPTSQRRGGKRPSARWTFPDRGSLLVNTEDGPKPGTVRVSVQRERLTGPERMPDAKVALQQLLAGL